MNSELNGLATSFHKILFAKKSTVAPHSIVRLWLDTPIEETIRLTTLIFIEDRLYFFLSDCTTEESCRMHQLKCSGSKNVAQKMDPVIRKFLR